MNQFDSWDEIRQMPRTFKTWDHLDEIERRNAEKSHMLALSAAKVKIHESLLRSYHILQETKKLLRADTSSEVVLAVITMLETNLPEKEGE